MSKQSVRQWHSYLGLFMAPSVLFFALTGALQVFSLHESHGDYRPPVLIEKLSSVHMDQVFALGDHHPPPGPQAPAGAAAAGAAPAEAGDHDEHKPGAATVILKGFFVLLALALALSSVLGLWIGLTQTRQRRTAWTLVVAGTLIPIALLLA